MSEQALPRAEPFAAAKPNGWWGTIVFVATELTLFGSLFGTYFYLRFRSAEWPPLGIKPPSATVPLVLAGVLVATSLPLLAASIAAGRGRVRPAFGLVFLALFVHAGYFAMQVHLFQEDLASFGPRGSAYGSIYFTLLGTHHAHVVVGMLLELWLLVRLLSGLTRYRRVALRSIALYWYFVNAVALLVVGAQLSASV